MRQLRRGADAVRTHRCGTPAEPGERRIQPRHGAIGSVALRPGRRGLAGGGGFTHIGRVRTGCRRRSVGPPGALHHRTAPAQPGAAAGILGSGSGRRIRQALAGPHPHRSPRRRGGGGGTAEAGRDPRHPGREGAPRGPGPDGAHGADPQRRSANGGRRRGALPPGGSPPRRRGRRDVRCGAGSSTLVLLVARLEIPTSASARRSATGIVHTGDRGPRHGGVGADARADVGPLAPVAAPRSRHAGLPEGAGRGARPRGRAAPAAPRPWRVGFDRRAWAAARPARRRKKARRVGWCGRRPGPSRRDARGREPGGARARRPQRRGHAGPPAPPQPRRPRHSARVSSQAWPHCSEGSSAARSAHSFQALTMTSPRWERARRWREIPSSQARNAAGWAP